MSDTIYYTYIIRNKKTKKKYIGTRTCPPHKTPYNDESYYGGGVDIREDIERYGKHNFNKRVLNTFETRAESYRHEAELHNRYDVGNNQNFYNKKKEVIKGLSEYIKAPKVWYNNGKVYTKFPNGHAPEGFVKGILLDGEWVKNWENV